MLYTFHTLQRTSKEICAAKRHGAYVTVNPQRPYIALAELKGALSDLFISYLLAIY